MSVVFVCRFVEEATPNLKLLSEAPVGSAETLNPVVCEGVLEEPTPNLKPEPKALKTPNFLRKIEGYQTF